MQGRVRGRVGPGVWTLRSLALIALPLVPLAARAQGPLAAAGPVLELHSSDGSILADRTVTLTCPDESDRSLDSDAQGRVQLEAGWETEGCTVRVGDGDGALVRVLGSGLADLEAINLARRPAPSPGRTVAMEEFRNIPVGDSTSRDFTMVVEASATASGDSAGISLAGTTGAETSHGLEPTTSVGQGITAGRLTAGAVDDVRSTVSFRDFLRTLGDQKGAVHHRFARPRHVVRVVDRQGRPIAGARVSVAGREFRTRRDGRVVLAPGWDGLSGGESLKVDTQGVLATTALKIAGEQRVVVPGRAGQANPPTVDLALVLDTTGSMGDELSYLQAELGALLSRLDTRHGQLDIRWSLVVYRDEGDEYVARTYDFSSDFERFSGVLAEQAAGGGGDVPEAVHTALALAQQLSWRDADVATRVLLHVADAPPHADKVQAALEAADGLRAAGTAIYPVAASGVDATAEFSMRAMAMFSGGQYVFLTDDSGIGNPHREATASCFRVEPLIEVLGRILEAEIAGQRPVLPKGSRGGGCKEGQSTPLARSPTVQPRRRHHPLERSLFDDDAASDFLHQPRTITLRP